MSEVKEDERSQDGHATSEDEEAMDQTLNTKKYKSRIRTAYNNWFWDEAYQFFDPFSKNRDLRKSRIHKDGRCKYLQNSEKRYEAAEVIGSSEEESDYDMDLQSREKRSGGYLQNQGMGSLWTGKEKQLFFHYLSRHSIHSIDTWSKRIPTKSKFEILTYYNVLKQNLEELKLLHTKKHGGILSYEEFPIAYELDESWISLEDELSRDVNEPSTSEEIAEKHASMEIPTDGVIDWNNWYKRWDPIYSRHRLMEYYPSNRQPNVFNKETMQMMEALASSYTYKLLRETIVPVIDRKSVPRYILNSNKILKKSRMRKLKASCKVINAKTNENGEIEIKTTNHEFPHVVTEKDVIDAIVRLRLHKNDRTYLTYPESIIETISKFDIQPENGKIFKNKKILRHLKVPLLLQNIKTYVTPLSYPSLDALDGDPGDPENDPEHRNVGILGPWAELSDTPVSLRQQELDTTIDANDRLKSVKYGHVLTTWLSISCDARTAHQVVHVT